MLHLSPDSSPPLADKTHRRPGSAPALGDLRLPSGGAGGRPRPSPPENPGGGRSVPHPAPRPPRLFPTLPILLLPSPPPYAPPPSLSPHRAPLASSPRIQPPRLRGSPPRPPATLESSDSSTPDGRPCATPVPAGDEEGEPGSPSLFEDPQVPYTPSPSGSPLASSHGRCDTPSPLPFEGRRSPYTSPLGPPSPPSPCPQWPSSGSASPILSISSSTDFSTVSAGEEDDDDVTEGERNPPRQSTPADSSPVSPLPGDPYRGTDGESAGERPDTPLSQSFPPTSRRGLLTQRSHEGPRRCASVGSEVRIACPDEDPRSVPPLPSPRRSTQR